MAIDHMMTYYEIGALEQQLKNRMNTYTKKIQSRPSFIPKDIIHDILLALPAKSLARFRSVSKSWHAISTDPSFLLSHDARKRADRSTVFLLNPFPEKHGGFIELFAVTTSDVESRDRVRINLPDHRESKFVSIMSCDGMLCIRGLCTESYYIYNTLTGEWIATLPDPHPRFSGSLCSFYFHASSGEYRLLGTYWDWEFKSYEGEFKFEVMTMGKHSWNWRQLDNSYCRFYDPQLVFASFITVDNKVHWVGNYVSDDSSSDDTINFFDTDSEEFRRISPPCYLDNTFRHHLVEIEGRLGLCQVTSRMEMDVWVLKDYAEEGEWIKRHTISIEGIKDAPSMYSLCPYLPVMFPDSDKQLLHIMNRRKRGDTFIFDSKLKKLKKIGSRGYGGQCSATFVEITLTSREYFYNL